MSTHDKTLATRIGDNTLKTRMRRSNREVRTIRDNYRIKNDAYFSCKNNTVCAGVVSESDAEILASLYADAYHRIENDVMTNSEWTEAHEEAARISEIAEDKTSP